MDIEPCPIDRSELVFPGCMSGWPGRFDVDYYYCPKYDAGFVCWKNPDHEKPVVFTWRRTGSELTLGAADASRVSDYRRHGWEAAQSNMLHRVRTFRQGRFSQAQRCPNDAGRIPQVGEAPCHEGSPVRFYWCKYCTELFAFLRDEHYGWQCIVSFSHNGKGGYQLWKASRSSPYTDLILEHAASLPPPSAFQL
jgi:hypothetical protein